MEKEIWKDVQGYEFMYRVSSWGRVITYGRTFFAGVNNTTKQVINEHFPKLFLSEKGYVCVWLNKDGKSKRCKVHRLVAQAFIENPDNLPEVNHLDGNKLNCAVTNLEWATRQGNMTHASENGLIPSGTRNAKAKLTEEDVVAIRNSNESSRKLAKRFGVGATAICRIKNYRGYKNVIDPTS